MVKVLAIDDDQDHLELLRRILRERHYSVATARNGQEALKVMKRVRPRVVLSDLKMPHTDGFVLLAKLKEMNQSVSFIVITGYATPENFRRAYELGVSRFLEKPVALSQLFEAVQDVLCKKRLAEVRSRLRLYHGGSCPFGSCILKGDDPCPSPHCPYKECPG